MAAKSGKPKKRVIGTPFTSEYQPKNPNRSGRKTSLVKQYSAKFDVSMEDVRRLLAKFLFDMTKTELIELSKRNDVPLFFNLTAGAFLKDIVRGERGGLDSCLDRIYGRSTVRHEIDVVEEFHVKKEDLSNKTEEELKIIYKKLLTDANSHADKD